MMRFVGTLESSDAAKRYLYLPFEVPKGDISRIDVSYRYSKGSIIDLGLLDPNVVAFPSRTGFRGWSGSARASVFVASDEATPGYIAGEIPAGTWQIMLGLAKIAPEGCHYEVKLCFDNGVRPVFNTPVYQRVRKPFAGWYKGDLQSHSYYSDALGSVEDLLMVAKERELDFLAVTDHNTHSHHYKLAELSSNDLLLIPGEELTTYRGHANVWGLNGWADFRIHHDSDLDTLIDDIHARGGLFSVNHPKALPECLGCDWDYAIPERADSLEAWQGPWMLKNWESLVRYDEVLKQGRRLTLVGGSDRHQPGYPDNDPLVLQLGSPSTFLYLEELSVLAVLKAIRQGQAFVSESPQGPRLELRVGEAVMGQCVEVGKDYEVSAHVAFAKGDRLYWLGTEGVIRQKLVEHDDFTDIFNWRAQGSYLRLEVVAEASLAFIKEELEHFRKHPKFPKYLSPAQILQHPWRRALSNPVYVKKSL